MSENKYCEQCGTALGEGLRFCENCGNPVGGGGEAQQPSAVPVANATPFGGLPRNVVFGIGGGVLALALIAFGWGRIAPQDAPTPTPTSAPKVVATAPVAGTKTSALPPLVSTATKAVATSAPTTVSVPTQPAATRTVTSAPPTPTPRATVAPTPKPQTLSLESLVGVWEIVDGPAEVIGEHFRIFEDEGGGFRLRMVSELDGIAGIEDIQRFYLDLQPEGGELVGEIVTVEDEEEVDREATTLSFDPRSGELTIANDETGDSILATRAR